MPAFHVRLLPNKDGVICNFLDIKFNSLFLQLFSEIRIELAGLLTVTESDTYNCPLTSS